MNAYAVVGAVAPWLAAALVAWIVALMELRPFT